MTTTSSDIMQTSTLPQLNNLSAEQNMLIMLRILCTSDLTFHYMMYEKSTLTDLLITADGIHQMTSNDGSTFLTAEEDTEYLVLVNQIQEYIDQK